MKKVKYSPTELRLIDILKSKKPMTSIQLINRFYAGRRDVPFHAGIQITNAIRQLERKFKHNHERWRIERVGQRPISFCLIVKSQRRTSA